MCFMWESTDDKTSGMRLHLCQKYKNSVIQYMHLPLLITLSVHFLYLNKFVLCDFAPLL